MYFLVEEDCNLYDDLFSNGQSPVRSFWPCNKAKISDLILLYNCSYMFLYIFVYISPHTLFINFLNWSSGIGITGVEEGTEEVLKEEEGTEGIEKESMTLSDDVNSNSDYGL